MLYELECEALVKLPGIGSRSILSLTKSKSKLSKALIADNTGVISAYTNVGNKLECKWRTQAVPYEITAIEYEPTSRRIYYAFTHIIKAIDRKGKQVFHSDTFTTETLSVLKINSLSQVLYAAGVFVLNMLLIKDNTFGDAGSYIFQDKISDIILPRNSSFCIVSLHGKDIVLLKDT